MSFEKYKSFFSNKIIFKINVIAITLESNNNSYICTQYFSKYYSTSIYPEFKMSES